MEGVVVKPFGNLGGYNVTNWCGNGIWRMAGLGSGNFCMAKRHDTMGVPGRPWWRLVGDLGGTLTFGQDHQMLPSWNMKNLYFGGLHLQALSFLIAQSVGAWVGWRPCMCKGVTPPQKKPVSCNPPRSERASLNRKVWNLPSIKEKLQDRAGGKRIDRSYGRSLKAQSCEFWYLVFN